MGLRGNTTWDREMPSHYLRLLVLSKHVINSWTLDCSRTATWYASQAGATGYPEQGALTVMQEKVRRIALTPPMDGTYYDL